MLLDGSLAGHDVCTLSLTGIRDDYPPAEPEALLEFARSLPAAGTHQEAVRPGDDWVSSRCPAGLRRLRERLSRSHPSYW
jgi:hypothetical protein